MYAKIRFFVIHKVDLEILFFRWWILHFSAVSRTTYEVTLIYKHLRANQKGFSRKTLILNERKNSWKLLLHNIFNFKIKLIIKSCLTGSEPDPAKEIDSQTLAQGKALRVSVLLRQAWDHIRSFIFIPELLKPVALLYSISQASFEAVKFALEAYLSLWSRQRC